MSDGGTRLRHRIEFALVRLAGGLACALPERAAASLGRTLGSLARLAGVRVAVARANLLRALPERDAAAREAILREAYAQAGMSAIEMLRFPLWTPERLDRLARNVGGLEHVAAARRLGRGIVLVTGHYGAPELLGAVLARQGHPLTYLVRGQTNPLVDADLQARRRALGVRVVDHGASVRAVLRALKANEGVAMIADQDAGRRGVFVPFFGGPASTPPGPAEFALRAGAPIMMGFLARDRHGGYAGEMLPLHLPTVSGDRERDLRELTAWHAHVLEERIRARPEQWLWTHRRWKTAAPDPESPARTVLAGGLAMLLAIAAFAPARGAPAAPVPTTAPAPADTVGPGAALPNVASESAFDGAGSSVFPLSEARVRRVFEDVRIRRVPSGWTIDAEEIFQAGVAPARAAMGLPDYRASLGGDSSAVAHRGTVRRLAVTVDGLPMAVTDLPGSAAPGEDLGGIERVYRWEVPFAAEEIRTVRMSYAVGDSRTDGGEPLLFFYLNPGSLWDGEAPKITASVDLGDVDPEDLIPAWLRPAGYRVYGSQVIWRRGAGDAVADLALAYRAGTADPLAPFADRQKGPLALAADAREEWFERLSVRETRYWAAFLRARRGAPVDSTGPAAALRNERWYRPAEGYRDDRLPRDERLLLARLDDRLSAWRRAQVPRADSAADSLASPSGGPAGAR